jgi:Domain of unknown function (DUF4345)
VEAIAVLGKIVLWVSAIAFTGYGLACLLSPGMPAAFAGLSITNGDALAEIGAMYGGLQTGLGLFCLLGALRSQLYRPALGLLVMCMSGMALSRLAWTLIGTDPVGAYTYGAMAYEFTAALLAALALKQTDNP